MISVVYSENVVDAGTTLRDLELGSAYHEWSSGPGFGNVQIKTGAENERGRIPYIRHAQNGWVYGFSEGTMKVIPVEARLIAAPHFLGEHK